MSRAARKTDVERTAIMLDLLHRRYLDAYSHTRPGPGPRYVVMEEVAPSTGGFSRLADVLVLSCWRSDGLSLSGYEIKASRGDLKKELADPSKSQAIARYCDSWSLLVWDADVHAGLTIPPTWGLFTVKESGGVYELEKVRAPKPLKPEQWPKTFVASMVRNASTQSPGSIYLGRACASSYREGVDNGRSIERTEIRRTLDALRKHLYGDRYWEHPDDAETIMRDAIAAIQPRSDRIRGAVASVTGVKP